MSIALHDIGGAFVDFYVNAPCAIAAAERRKRFYGRESIVRQGAKLLYTTEGPDPFPPRSPLGLRGRHPATLFARVYGDGAYQNFLRGDRR
jgi:hypothetical protein